MNARLIAIFLFSSLCAAIPVTGAQRQDLLAWPEPSQQTKPWVYWWWLGSAVDKENLTNELTRYRDAGMGGVHVIPIYGAKGWEHKYIPYLSEQWMQMLRHTVTEGQRLGLGVDMTTGSGWCFGGPNVPPERGTMRVAAKVLDVPAGAAVREKLDPKKTLVALLASGENGGQIDLSSKVKPDGTVDWTAPRATKVLILTATAGKQAVKRAAPGGEGPMLNPYCRAAVANYLLRFQQAFDAYDGLRPRAMYHDSYEYQNDWSPDLLAEFETRRGYRLQDHLLEMFADAGEATARVKCDYRQTVAEMVLENLAEPWVNWCHRNHFSTRYQAHGSPGNLLDLYATADVPETEMFHEDREILVSKFASSAAHVAGRQLVASETGTWLAEHFTETLADMKGLLDDLFVSGVNHVFYHGTCYSPDECPWPGFLFYASTEMNPRNAIWHDVPTLNGYIARCQSILQSGRSDSDVLLYWPIHDLWHNDKGTAMDLTVHGRYWVLDQPLGALARQLWQRGFQFDYVSDRQLAAATSEPGAVVTAGGRYKVVLVPRCTHMPIATLRKLLALAEAGQTVVFQDQLPTDVPGLSNLDANRIELKSLLASLHLSPVADGKCQTAAVGSGRVLVGDAEAALAIARVVREPIMDLPGVKIVRREREDGWRDYFIVNGGTAAIDGWVTLSAATSVESTAILDPMTGRAGIAAGRTGASGQVEAYLQLTPGQSLIVRAAPTKLSGEHWLYRSPAGEVTKIGETWDVRFVSGGPVLPKPFKLTSLTSWASQDDPEAQRFAGSAVYATTFNAPGGAAGTYRLDLGKVCQSARVRLNGKDLGTLLLPPFAVDVELRPTGNALEVEVTNVSANRIRDLDLRKVQWRIFRDINIVNINYKPLDASKWPLTDSGLLGPVTVRPVKTIEPK